MPGTPRRLRNGSLKTVKAPEVRPCPLVHGLSYGVASQLTSDNLPKNESYGASTTRLVVGWR